jgi:hypothetical protein
MPRADNLQVDRVDDFEAVISRRNLADFFLISPKRPHSASSSRQDVLLVDIEDHVYIRAFLRHAEVRRSDKIERDIVVFRAERFKRAGKSFDEPFGVFGLVDAEEVSYVPEYLYFGDVDMPVPDRIKRRAAHEGIQPRSVDCPA